MSGWSLLRMLQALCAALALVVLPGLQVAHARSVSEDGAPSTRASAGGGPYMSASASELAAPLQLDRRWRLPGKEGAGRRAAARSAASTAPGEAGRELDCIGNVRRLRGGARYGAGAALPSDLGGYKYTAFGRSVAADAGTPAPVVDGVSFTQPLRWQGRWLDTATGIYDVRNRQWSPELGAFLSPDEFIYHRGRGTLWSWPGQNPILFRDPSGHIAPVVVIIVLAGAGLVVSADSSSTATDSGDTARAAVGASMMAAGAFQALGGANAALEAVKNAATVAESVAGAVAAGVKACVDRGGNPIANLPRVGSATKIDQVKPIRDAAGSILKEFPATPVAHGFSNIVDNFATTATRFKLADGAVLYQLEGSYIGDRLGRHMA